MVYLVMYFTADALKPQPRDLPVIHEAIAPVKSAPSNIPNIFVRPSAKVSMQAFRKCSEVLSFNFFFALYAFTYGTIEGGFMDEHQ